MAESEGDDSLLDHLRELVRHPRAPPLARAEHLEPVALDLALPAVVGRAVNAEDATGLGDRGAVGQIEELQAIAEQRVIIRHAAHSFFAWR
jgi:hypothetical protein